MFALVFVLLFVVALIWSCIALARYSARQQRERRGPADMRRADDAARAPSYDNQMGYRAAQDASNWWGGPQS